jgi:hypothetical protein
VLPAWNVVLRALGTEPRAIHQIKGASGFPHTLLAAGTDEKRKRLIIISPEPDPRVAAMVQADLQAADNSIQVLTARPIIQDVTAFGQIIAAGVGKQEVSREEIWEAIYSQGESITKRSELLNQFYGEEDVRISANHMIQSMMQQMMLAGAPEQSPFIAERGENSTIPELANSKMDVTVFEGVDILAGDREVGICPLPFAQMSDSELETVLAGRDAELVTEILQAYEVAQYFFPGPRPGCARPD